MGFSGGAETRYKKYPCKRKSYETICENIVSRYQTLVSSLPREAVFRHRRPKAHFMTGRTGSPVTRRRTPSGVTELVMRMRRKGPGSLRSHEEKFLNVTVTLISDLLDDNFVL